MTTHNQGISQKLYLELVPPSERDPRSDQDRLRDALSQRNIRSRFSFEALRKLSVLASSSRWAMTVSLALVSEESADPLWEIVDLQPQDTSHEHYGYAIDLGSTTVVVRLLNLDQLAVIDQVSVLNRQTAYGEDILSRIFYSKDHPEHLEQMRAAAIASIMDAFLSLTQRTGIAPETCLCAVIAGNTCMTHFLLGLDAFCVFSSPYAVHVSSPGFLPARSLQLPMPGYVYLYPGKANYVGGDIISGIIAVGMYRHPDISVLFDVGTNGELAAGSSDFLLCGAGAAGPALEGGSVVTGMRAAPGAVDSLRLEDDQFILTTIEGQPPEGICGSGIVDLISELFLQGWIDLTGHFQPEGHPKICLRELPGTLLREYAVEYAPGLWFFQRDIDEFIRTKSAAYTMMDYLLSQAGIPLESITRFYMCGSFGAHIRISSAVNIGMYPDVDEEKICQAGNTSLEGCAKLLTDRSLLTDIQAVLDLMTYIQYGAIDDFLERMRASSALPHTDIERFPSVLKRLREHTR